jgi:ferredoxin
MENLPLVFRGCVLPDDQTFEAKPDQSLFKSLEQAKIAWPVSCRTGTCRTCIGRLVEGQVSYEVEWPGLSAEEKREGWILPCVARPLGDVTLKHPFSE